MTTAAIENDDDHLLKVAQIASFMNLSRWRVRRLITDKELPAVHIGGCTRVRLGDIRRLIHRNLETLSNHDAA